jgi:enoyl-CoA hydratase
MHCFSLTIENHIAHLVLNQPDTLNTMGPVFWRELDTVLTELHHGNSARALVISSTGKHFSAGMALDTFAGAIQMDDQSPEGRAAMFDSLSDMQATFTKLEKLRIPVIAAIQGGCIGGAVDMVTACCLRYAVNAVLPTADAALGAAMQCAREIAAKPPIAIWGTKQAIHYARDHTVDESLAQMGWLQAAIWSNRHVGEAVVAMKSKQAGEFPALAALKPFRELA